jgi:pilus assembly protein CpaB
MKKNNLVKLLGVALVVAIVATGIFYGLFVNKLSSSTGTKTLVVAAKPLKPGTVVALADLKTIPWATDQLPKGTFQTPDQVAGSTVFDSIEQDQPVLVTSLASSQSGGGSGVPTGMRAVSIHVTDSTGVLALLKSGQKVDVQVVVGRGSGKDIETEVRTALEGVSVLTVTPARRIVNVSRSLP